MKVYFKMFPFIIFILIFSCNKRGDEKLYQYISKKEGKPLKFPNEFNLTVQGEKTIETRALLTNDFKIVTYVDSTGCTGCKLKLDKWKLLIKELSTLTNDSLPVLFILHPKTKEELVNILKRNSFKYPIFIDENDIFNKLNRFSDDVRLQTFLLDKEQKIVAFGNPIHNPHIKKIYLKIILGNNVTKINEGKLTETRVYKSLVTLGHFTWQKEMQTAFVLTNTGVNPLVIADVSTSCGCTSVEYNKEPVKPGDELKLIVKYKADEPGHFSKSIKVFCNTKDSPISLKITGEALAN